MVENFYNTQRFRVYRKIVAQKIGFDTFEHFVYEAISGYLLINGTEPILIEDREKAIISMFANTYQNLIDI